MSTASLFARGKVKHAASRAKMSQSQSLQWTSKPGVLARSLGPRRLSVWGPGLPKMLDPNLDPNHDPDFPNCCPLS